MPTHLSLLCSATTHTAKISVIYEFYVLLSSGCICNKKMWNITNPVDIIPGELVSGANKGDSLGIACYRAVMQYF